MQQICTLDLLFELFYQQRIYSTLAFQYIFTIYFFFYNSITDFTLYNFFHY